MKEKDSARMSRNNRTNDFGREVIEGIRNRATRFLIVSLLSVSVLCVTVFIYLAVQG